MGKVDAVDFVAWLMVVRVKPKAGDGLGNDSPLGKAVVIGALEEVFLGMRIANQAGTVTRKHGPQVATLETGEPETVPGQNRITAANHFKFQVGHDLIQRYGRMVDKISVSVTSDFFRTEQDEEDGARWANTGRQTRAPTR